MVLVNNIRHSTKIFLISVVLFFGNELRQVITYFTIKLYKMIVSLFEHVFFSKVIITDAIIIKHIKAAMANYDLLKTHNYEITYDVYNKMEYRIDQKISFDKPYPFKYKNVYFYITEDENKIEIKYFKLPFTTKKLNLEEFLEDCEKIYNKINESNKTDEYNCLDFVDKKWMRVNKVNIVDTKTIYYTSDIKIIMDDVDNFIKNKKYYLKQNLPYKRCYLVHGPPGTGKTTCAKIIASKYGYDMCLVSLNQNNITDDDIKKAFHALPPKCVVLFDDFDNSLIRNTNEEDKPIIQHVPGNPPMIQRKPLSITTLFNIFDGVCTKFNCIFFITTNHYESLREKIDKAFFRKGRIDIIQELNYMTSDEIEDFYIHFYSNIFDQIHHTKIVKYAGILKEKIEEHSNGAKLGLAQLHGHFGKYMTDYRDACEHMDEILNCN